MKLKAGIITVCILFITLIQSTIFEYIEVFGIKPNLLIVFIISFGLLKDNVEGAVIGFFTGLAQDIVSGKVFGFYALLGLYLGLIIGSLNKRLYRENYLVVIFFTFVSTVAYEGAVYIFSMLGKGQMSLWLPLKNTILPEAVYNSIISIFIFAFVIRLNDKLRDLQKAARKY